MTAFFNRMFTWANFWALLRGLAVCLAIYMVCCFAWPLISRAANTTHYVVFQAPTDAGNWLSDKFGLRPSAKTKTTAQPAATPDATTPPTFGGQAPASVTLANQAREEELREADARFQKQRKRLWSSTMAQGESLERALACGSPHPGRTVSVTVYDENDKPVLVAHELVVERSGETEVIPCSPNSTKHLQVGYGPLRVRIGANVPGAGYSDFQVAEFATDEVGKKRLQLHVTMPAATTP